MAAQEVTALNRRHSACQARKGEEWVKGQCRGIVWETAGGAGAVGLCVGGGGVDKQ